MTDNAHHGLPPKATSRRFQTWPVIVLAFGSLVLLIAGSGLTTLRESERFYEKLAEVTESFAKVDDALQNIRTSVYVSSLLLRDFVIDEETRTVRPYQRRFTNLHKSADESLQLLAKLSGDTAEPRLKVFQSEIDAYWQSLEPILKEQRAIAPSDRSKVLHEEVVPHRDAVLSLADEIDKINTANVSKQKQQIETSEREYRNFLIKITSICVILAILVTIAGAMRIRHLESRSSEQHLRTQEAEHEMRRLSQELVKAQEEERRVISRELHDEIGQMLTGLRMEIVALQRISAKSDPALVEKLQQSRVLLEQVLQAVRDIAMGLRPSMLDDLGLIPALEWQARDFARRFDIPVSVEAEGEITALPDTHSIYIYRVVQEALTNVARHARAHAVAIKLSFGGSAVSLIISDDGVGFQETLVRRGIGLLGIQERVHELGGEISTRSIPNKGTELSIRIPVQAVAVYG